jgi:hypothetical protein
VTLGPPGRELQADRGWALNLKTFHSDLDDIATKGLTPGLELDLLRGKSLSVNLQAKVAPGTIVPDTDETPATADSHLWKLVDDRAKMLPSTKPDLDDDEEGNLGWKLVPYFGAALLFFSWIVQSGLAARKRKAARLGFQPDVSQPIESVNGASSAGARHVAAAFSTIDERQQKAAGEKKEAVLEHFSRDPDVEKARAEFESAQKIEETFHEDFYGVGLS